MGKYSIKFKKSVVKDLRQIPKQQLNRILMRIDSLVENPRLEGCVKLTAKEYYRVRSGQYRIVYEVRDSELIIIVIKVAHRSHIYKNP